jgi:Heterokaryon incompatibility protein (HET)
MRLLNTQTLELKSFIGNQVPDYVILSHTWGQEEITFEDITKRPLTSGSTPDGQNGGFAKILGTCQQAVRHGYEWVWIDSCCIDKSSSSELQEAINSMWAWYKNANICYAYLVDVPDRVAGWDECFSKSRWFTRGWTLQELIAPGTIEFYAADWSYIGSKLRRFAEIQAITGISDTALKTGSTKSEIAAEVLSWAAHRNVSRDEDRAYSLMGLFDTNMPMMYGEGGRKAFLRLQEEIFKR